MRALVTGGAGFIGSHLTEKLLARGHQVCVIDDLSTGSIENLALVRQNPALSVYVDTIFNRYLLAELIDSADVIFHLAAAVGVRNIIEAPVRTIETNVRGSELVLEISSKKRKRVLITSTSEVYGKSSKIPFRENDELVLGSTYISRWSYACSKAIDEFLALAYYRERKLPVTIVRLFNTSGPRQTGRYGMVLPTFVRQALTGVPLTVFGTGEQRRCFSHVEDIVSGIMDAVSSDRTNGEIFNLGTTEEVSIRALAEAVISKTRSASPIQYIPFEQAYQQGFEDMERRIPDISKALQCFGYRPKRSLDEIIGSVILSMRLRAAGAVDGQEIHDGSATSSLSQALATD